MGSIPAPEVSAESSETWTGIICLRIIPGLIPVRTQAEASWLEKNSEQEEAGEETPEKEDPPSSAPASGSWQKNQDGMVVPQRGRQLSCGLLAAD